ncbi:CHAT domain-containing protein [Ekhidna sp.]
MNTSIINRYRITILLLITFSIINGVYSQSPIDTKFDQALKLKQTKNFRDAALMYRSIYQVSLDENKHIPALEAKIRESECYWMIYDLEQAIKANKVVRELIETGVEFKDQFEYQVLYNDGAIEHLRKNYAIAIANFQEAISLLKRNSLEPEEWEARIRQLLTISLYDEGHLDSAIESAEIFYDLQEKRLFKQKKDVTAATLLEMRVSIGNLHIERGNYYEAKNCFKQAIDLCEDHELNHLSGYPRALYGSSLAYIGAVQEGLDIIQGEVKKMASSKTLTHPNNIMSLALLAEVLMKDGQLIGAEVAIDQFINYSSDIFNPFLNATGTYIKAEVLYRNNQLDKSLKYFDKTRNLLTEKVPNSVMIPLSFKRMVEILFKNGNDSKALSLLKESKEFVESTHGKSSSNWFGLEMIRADLLIENGNLDSAESTLQGIIDLNRHAGVQGFQILSDPWYQMLSLKKLAEIHALKGGRLNIEKGLKLLFEGDSLVDHLRYTYNNYHDRMSLNDSVSNFYNFAITYCEKNSKNDSIEARHIYHFLERNKAITLYQHLQNKRNVKNELQEISKLHDLENDLGYHVSKVYSSKSGKSDNSRKKALAIQSKIDVLRQQLKKDGSLGIHRYMRPSDPSKIQKGLDEKELIISYSVGSEYIYALIMDRNEYSFKKLVSKKEIYTSINSFLQKMSPASLDTDSAILDYKSDAYTLFDQLLEPVLRKKAYEKLIIIPSGELSKIPFEALVSNKQGNSFKSLSYVIKSYEVTYAHSFTLLDFLKSRTVNTNQKVFALAPTFTNNQEEIAGLNATERSELSVLPYAQEEVRSIEKYFPTKLFIGALATEESVVSDADEYGIIHIASHSLVNTKEPLNSKILLTKSEANPVSDGLLHAYEVIQLDLNSEVVVLSACNTGVGKINKGEGALSLALSFFYAGAKSVLMSQWPVNDLSTSKLMEAFYKYLSSDFSKSEALRKAKLDYLKEANEALAHPYYWGGFVLVGDPDPLTSNKKRLWLFTTGFLMLLFISIIVYRRFS